MNTLRKKFFAFLLALFVISIFAGPIAVSAQAAPTPAARSAKRHPRKARKARRRHFRKHHRS